MNAQLSAQQPTPMTPDATIAALRAENEELKLRRDEWRSDFAKTLEAINETRQRLTESEASNAAMRKIIEMVDAGCDPIAEAHQLLKSTSSGSEILGRLQRYEMIIALWNITFQKYESWKANKVPAKDWPESVLADYAKLSAFTPPTAQQSKGENEQR